MEQAINNKTYVKPAVTARLVRTTIEHADGATPYATTTVEMLDTDGRAIRIEQVALTAEQLAAWSDDDTVLIPLVLEALGLTAK